LAQLALAFAVRAIRTGSTCFDPAQDPGVPGLTWPDPTTLLAAVSASSMSSVLTVEHSLIYLDRYLELEKELCKDLQERAENSTLSPDIELLNTDLDRIFPAAETETDPDFGEQRAAAEKAAQVGTLVITGGPGTGKTTTVAGLLAILQSQSQHAGNDSLRVALAAPTGKAAARMREALVANANRLDFTPAERDWLISLESATLHRLLGFRHDNHTRFKHNRLRHLPHDVVVVDETSMASLEIVARLVEAMRPDARLILVGDADQLASVEAGAVLHDVVAGWSANHIARLSRSHRFSGAIGKLAAAVRDGDSQTALAVLTDPTSAARLVDPAEAEQTIKARSLPGALALVSAANAGEVPGAFNALNQHRLLCAHRGGPTGASTWNNRITSWLRSEVGFDQWYPGRPILVTKNDAQLGIFNGDAGVTVSGPAGVAVEFDSSPAKSISPARLPQVQTGYAMTIHRSQGSEFADVTVLLPSVDSRVMSRQLLYTAITRAISSVTIIGTADDVRSAISRQASRSSGISERLAEN